MLILWLALMSGRTLLFGPVGLLLDALILGLAVASDQRLRPICDWSRTPLYLAAALASFALASALTCSAPRAYWRGITASLRRGARQWQYLKRAALSALHEELIWRVVLQGTLSSALGALPALVLVASAFTYWHRHTLRAQIFQIVELLLFALLLGTAYALLNDALCVFLLHFIRNYLVQNGQ
ncbi:MULTISPECIES: CPBP family intramembrane glutamic endopeptidase [unclassified Undibacterium]|uniref:CPBP family intramembrane glutamic endopeptidase n=1 Tax=unclassified Undibacterium TaxID=2630295 RepID=UPI002AC91A79|nr:MULTISPECIES: CPBP family intramembrane glutamic endopeptidase [unclassified Undibacterium]MEB0140414.1 CPBP family intramembrane metalloprotease [Undibacterium sp. CCC2.1]MEB0171696.1 CPBP family intramembrane metalloprotease [Undibacterium sp. CCC1.1]MEB0177417.1 CPBP family intramembrane metalloprotease [Undibacterium sp. CCC3.4]MEB0215042.1 CPBP family intramembrane metalloprotease [Undibacterium sp. 5I2]WPX45111.1 CPBP family intramembrane glutamic endopeptidase [Undibacterium sp. CCC3